MELMTRKQARAAGLKRFFNGIPCKEGHIAERQTSNNSCTECNKGKAALRVEYMKQYRSANIERVREHQRRYAEKNAERETQRKRAYYLANKAEHNERSRLYRQANADRIRAYIAAWLAENRTLRAEYFKEHYRRNRAEYIKRARQRETGLVRATPSWANLSAIRHIYAVAGRMRDAGHDVHVDHFIPLQGDLVCGLHIATNLRIMQARTNLQKRNAFAVV